MAESVSIRQATLSDIPVIRKMADIVFRKTYAEILSPDQMEYMMDWMYSEDSLKTQVSGEGKWFFIAEPAGGEESSSPAGYVSVEHESFLEDGRELFHLQKLYVLPEYQNSGLGRLMFEHVRSFVSTLAPQGSRIELNVNRNNKAVGFYRKIGMEIARQGDFPIGNGYFMNDFIFAIDN